MGEAANGAERFEPGDSEQDEEDVYEVESIIDMRMEEVSNVARSCLILEIAGGLQLSPSTFWLLNFGKRFGNA